MEKVREEKIKKTIRELLIYLMFLLSASVVSFGSVSISLFYGFDLLNHLFVEKTFLLSSDVQVNFKEITTIPEFWRFTKTVLLDGLHRIDEDGKTVDDPEMIKIADENYVMGPVRIRQIRVRNDSCQIHEIFKHLFKECYSYYSKSNEDQTSFGLRNGSAWNYHSAEELGGFITWGRIHFYSGSGYYQDLTTNRNTNNLILKNLQEHFWVDRATRVVFIELTVYNANVNIFSNMKLITEITPSGGIIPSANFRIQKLLRFVDSFDYFLLGFQILFILQVFYYTFEEFQDIYYKRLKYFNEFWNWIDASIILIAYFAMGFSIFRYIQIQNVLEDFNANSKKFLDFDRLSFWEMLKVTMEAVCVFLVWIKVLKYLKFNMTMKQFSRTLARCTKDLLGFGLMFFIVFMAYAQLGYILFGTENSDFRTFQDSIFTLMRTILGDFDYLAIENNNRTLGPIYFLSYIFFVFFVLLNMFLAIINDTYSVVKSEVKEDHLEIVEYMKHRIMRVFRKLCFCKSKRCVWSDADVQIDHEEFELPKIEVTSLDVPKMAVISNELNCQLCQENSKEIRELRERLYFTEAGLDYMIHKFNDFLN